MKLKKISRGFAAFFVLIYIAMLALTSLAFEAQADVNQMLGTASYKIVDTGDGTEDTQYFKKTTRSIDSFMDQKLALVEEIVGEGIVLLKNDGVLPIASNAKVTTLGKASTALVYGGSSGNAAIGNPGNSEINWTLKRGLENAGLQVNPSVWAFYESQQLSYTAEPSAEPDPSGIPADDEDEYSDAAVVVFSRVTGEGGDAADGYYELTAEELALVKNAEEISEKVIVVINSPSAVAIHSLVEDESVGAILQVGGLGARGTKALGSVLTGAVNPSGKLTDIYATDSRSSAAYQMAGTKEYTNAAEILAAADTALGIGAGGAKYTLFSEGIYVGYKYYETRYEDSVMKQGNADGKAGAFHSSDGWNYADEVDYSFGYGLSYTSFTQELQNIAVEEGVITATVNVTNTGSLPGKEVVELYVQSPYTEYDRQNGVEKSSVQLVTFGKTGLLEPGAEETLTLKMDTYNIASYDAKAAKTWILEEGTYYFAVGNGAHEALNNILSAKGKTTADGMTANGDAALTKTWDNPTFTTLSNPTFTENGFNTENGLFHNNTDAQITNRLGDADPNIILGDSTVTYLTRTDWNGSWSSGIQALTANKAMIDHITFAPLYEKGEAVGDMYHYGMEGSMSAIMAMGKSYDDSVWDELLDQMIPEEMIATVGKNFGAIDPILAISFPGTSDNDGVGSGPATNYSSEYDQGSTVFEGITKYSTIDPRMYPSESVQASTFNQKLSYRTGEMMSEDCYYAGLTSLWGPGLNLHRHPYAGRNFEYYSEDSMMTYITGAQITAGLQSNGVIAGPKHFCFNDQETDRYGFAVYVNEQAARENSLRGFEGAVAVAKAKNIMTSLNRIGPDWVGESDELQNGILREEWGFDGYTITDNALEPYMCGRSIVYGNDKLMLLPGNSRSDELNKTALLNDVNLFAAVREACHRILYTFVNSKAMNGISSSIEVVPVNPWWKTVLIDADVIFGCLAALCIIGMLTGENKMKKEGN